MLNEFFTNSVFKIIFIRKEVNDYFHSGASVTSNVLGNHVIVCCPLPASPHCPRDGVNDTESSSCFEIFPEELSWTEARQQCLNRTGDLAIVRSDALRNLLANKVTQ